MLSSGGGRGFGNQWSVIGNKWRSGTLPGGRETGVGWLAPAAHALRHVTLVGQLNGRHEPVLEVTCPLQLPDLAVVRVLHLWGK